MDTLARGQGLPQENTIDWSRRPPDAKDGLEGPAYRRRWVNTSNPLGNALEPSQRPGSKIAIIASVWPQTSSRVSAFRMTAVWLPWNGGWNVSMDWHTCRVYDGNRVGEEVLEIWLQPADGKTHAEWPFCSWTAMLPNQRLVEPGAGKAVAIRSRRPEPRLRPMCLASAASFRDQAQRNWIHGRCVLDDIAASRNIRFRWRRPPPPSPTLLAWRTERLRLRQVLNSPQRRRGHSRTSWPHGFKASGSCWNKTVKPCMPTSSKLPIDEFCAAERTEEPTAIKPEN